MRHSRFLWLVAAAALVAAAPAQPRPPFPNWLPRYDLEFDLDVAKRELIGHMRATWTNHYQRSVHELVFNAHSHYVVPDNQIGFDAKMLELLAHGRQRSSRRQATAVRHRPYYPAGRAIRSNLPFHYEGDTKTTLVVPLPFELKPGEAVTIDLALRFHIPAKQGRWGQWQSITTLSNWLPVFAVFDETQPDNALLTSTLAGSRGRPSANAGNRRRSFPGISRSSTKPASTTSAPRCPATRRSAAPAPSSPSRTSATAGNNSTSRPIGVRDFAFLCSDNYCVYEGEVPQQPGVPAPSRCASWRFPNTSFTPRRWCASRPRRSLPTASGSAPIRIRYSPFPNRSSAGTATSAPRSS